MTGATGSRKNRVSLKYSFREGALPSAEHFADLIESSVNQTDEGFDKTDQDGLKISTTGDFDKLLSFYRGSPTPPPAWTVGYGKDKGDNTLLFRQGGDASGAVLALSPTGRVGINTRDPSVHLDVNGVVRATGRLGATYPVEPPVLADGEWYNITPPLTGCNAIEIMAGVGEEGKGRYAMLRAVAINVYNPKTWFFGLIGGQKRIRCHHAYYTSRKDRLQLRWDGEGNSYRLQLRTRCKYADGKKIKPRFYLTHLWFDPTMSGSWTEDEQLPALDKNVRAGDPADG